MADPLPNSTCMPVVLCDSTKTAPDNKVIAVVGLDGVTTYYEVAADGSTTLVTPDPADLGVCPGPPPELEYVEYDPTIHDAGVIEGSGVTGDPFQIPLPCCDDDHVNVGPAAPAGPPGDGTETYIEQPDPADASTWIVHYWVDTDGDEIGDAWVAVPSCCEDIDLCEIFDEAPVACADAIEVITSDGTVCGPTPITDITPSHNFAACDSAGFAMSPSQPAPVAHTFAAANLGSGMVGEMVYLNPNVTNLFPAGIPQTTFPLTINVPATSSNCAVFLQVSYGHESQPQSSTDSFEGISITQASPGLGPATLVGESDINPGYPGGQQTFWAGQTVYGFDGNGGGGTVTIDFTQHPAMLADSTDGVVAWHWVEVCEQSGDVLRISDFCLDQIQKTDTPGPIGLPEGNGGDSTDWDLGDCPSIVFAVARHVASNPNDISQTPTPNDGTVEIADAVDWWQPPGFVDELYDETSFNHWGACQMGWAAGFVDGGQGPWNWYYQGNNGAQYIGSPEAGALSVPLCTCTTGIGAVEDSVSSCEIEICNDNCSQDAVVRCHVQASVTVEAAAGDKVCVWPTVDGAPIQNQQICVDNTNGQNTAIQTFPISTILTDFSALLMPGECRTHVFAWRGETEIGGGTITVSDYHTECEIIHV